MKDNDHIDASMLAPRTATVARYIAPLREGGSLPALAEADDGYRYVVKLSGAGHGTKALIAEFIGAMLASATPLKVPQLLLLDLDEDFGRTEGDEEIQDLLQASRGINPGMNFLPGALTWDVAVNRPTPEEASMTVWLDAFLTNIDRTARNTNMLLWRGGMWLIDFGASLYFHHNWNSWESASLSPFPYVKDHALLREASRMTEADAVMKQYITPELIDAVVDLIPEDWLLRAEPGITPAEQRDVYRNFLKRRLENSKIFTDHAIEARRQFTAR